MGTRLLLAMGVGAMATYSTPAHAQQQASPAPAASSGPADPGSRLVALGVTPVSYLVPMLAGGASGLVPLGLTLAAAGLNQPALAVLAPLGFGAGHVVAGDPRRGALVGAGGVGALGLGVGLGWLLKATEPPYSGGGFSHPPDLSLLYYGAGFALTLVPYGLWASMDANALAWRAQGVDIFAPASVPLPPRPWRLGQAYDALPRVPVVTFESYKGLAMGASYEAIAEQLGRPGAERRWQRADDHSEAVYRWSNPDGSYLELTFVDGRLKDKSNRDLR